MLEVTLIIRDDGRIRMKKKHTLEENVKIIKAMKTFVQEQPGWEVISTKELKEYKREAKELQRLKNKLNKLGTK